MPSTPIRTGATALVALGLISLGATACGSSGASTVPAATTSPAAATTPAATGTTAEVRIVDFRFEPMAVSVKVGGTVTWTQVDSVGHSVQSDDGAWKTSGVLQPGQTFTHVFTRAGTFRYICGVHPYMKGTVTVTG